MKVVIHDMLDGKSYPFEGDRHTIRREIAKRFPWFVEYHESLEDILGDIDDQQMFSVEVTDDTEHPLLQYQEGDF